MASSVQQKIFIGDDFEEGSPLYWSIHLDQESAVDPGSESGLVDYYEGRVELQVDTLDNLPLVLDQMKQAVLQFLSAPKSTTTS